MRTNALQTKSETNIQTRSKPCTLFVRDSENVLTTVSPKFIASATTANEVFIYVSQNVITNAGGFTLQLVVSLVRIFVF